MAQAQVWDNCENFGVSDLCPPLEKSEVMNDFAYDVKIPHLIIPTNPIWIAKRGKEIDKLFCNICSEFKPIK
jgi:hypothetical protein